MFRWERERATRNREYAEDKYTDKMRDLAGQGSDEGPMPEEVRQAQEELLTLKQEKEKTDSVRANLEKELEYAKEKAAKIEQVRKEFEAGYCDCVFLYIICTCICLEIMVQCHISWQIMFIFKKKYINI